MPEDLGQLSMNIHPTALRPLLGLTVLVVEDSRFASEAVRLLCIRSGARIRRADSLTAAHRHLQLYRPSVVIVDIGLPDGSGIDLVREITQADLGEKPVILATSGADGEGLEAQAIAAGADGFLPKPIDSVSAFQQAILAHLPHNMRPSGPRLVSDEVIQPDTLSLREDLSHLDELLGSEPKQLTYAANRVRRAVASLRIRQRCRGVNQRGTQLDPRPPGWTCSRRLSRAKAPGRLRPGQGPSTCQARRFAGPGCRNLKARAMPYRPL